MTKLDLKKFDKYITLRQKELETYVKDTPDYYICYGKILAAGALKGSFELDKILKNFSGI